MKDIKVSIVVAVYNGATTLPRCLDSIFSQTWKNLEVICVNDCSPDNSLEILEKYASQYSNMRIINHSENKNGGGADNTGIKAATGDYVCMVDQDDWLNEDAVELLVNNSKNGGIDIILGQWCAVSSLNEKEYNQNLVIGGTRDENIEYSLLNGVRILGGLFKKDLYITNNLLYPEKIFWADNAIYNAILIAAKSIEVVDRVVYYYYIDTVASMSKQISLKSMQDRVLTNNFLLDNCQRIDVQHRYEEAIKYRYLSLSLSTIDMLKELKLSDSIDLISQIKQNLDFCMLGNRYINKFTSEELQKLKMPIPFLQKEHRKLRRKKVRKIIHSIRHKIVVALKTIIGMDPTKSIYQK